MTRKRFSEEDILGILRQIELDLASGVTVETGVKPLFMYHFDVESPAPAVSYLKTGEAGYDCIVSTRY